MKPLLAICCLLAAPAFAAPPKQPTDAELLQLLKGPQTYSDYWRRYVGMIELAEENFVRAAKLQRCDKVPSDRPLLLNPDYRGAIEEVLRNQLAFARVEDLGYRRWINRSGLYAFGRLTPSEQASFAAFYRDTALLKEIGALEVLEDFPHHTSNARYSEAEPAAPIWLKTYFQREGRLPALRKAIAAAAPSLVADFDRVRNIESHTDADAEWLSRLSQGLDLAQPKILDAYESQISAALKKRLAAFHAHPFQDWHAKAANAQGNPMLLAFFPAPPEEEFSDSELAGVRADLNAKYPMPEGFEEHSLSYSALKLASRQVERFCPPPKQN